MLRKVFIVLDFEDEAQVNELQQELNEFSNSRVLDGHKLRSMMPLYKKHKNDLMELGRRESRVVGPRGTTY